MKRHQPVMLDEVLELLEIQSGAIVIDGTLGHGGHAEAMLRRAGANGKLIGFDWDEGMLKTAETNLKEIAGERRFVHADYRDIAGWIKENNISGSDAILLDLGVNMEHFDDKSRGFSFLEDAPLDMRMDRKTKETASAWLNRASEGEIAVALREYGGERHAGLIAREIVRRRREGKMKRTTDLAEAATRAVPPRLREKRIHPATRAFQAIRIVINRELENLEEAISEIAKCLNLGGRIAVLSYHSGEDRAAKNAFRNLSKTEGFVLLTKSPLTPSATEVRNNPSSRSAKLRGLLRPFQEEPS